MIVAKVGRESRCMNGRCHAETRTEVARFERLEHDRLRHPSAMSSLNSIRGYTQHGCRLFRFQGQMRSPSKSRTRRRDRLAPLMGWCAGRPSRSPDVEREHRQPIPSLHRRREPLRRLIGSIPKTDKTGRSRRCHGANTAQHGAGTAQSRVLRRQCKSFGRDKLRHVAALTALGR
jgi:hypothetical protein